MGLLDDLRQQSTELKEKELGESEKKRKAQDTYKNHIQPKLIELYHKLSELVNHLNYIKPDIRVSYCINAADLKAELQQQNYSIEIDSIENTQLVSLSFQCVGDADINFSASDVQLIKKHIEYLNHYHLKYNHTENKNANHQVINATFAVKAVIPIAFQFQVDIDNSCLNFSFINFEGLGTQKYSLKHQQLTEDFFDDLGRFILRQKENIFKIDITDAAKEQIRAQIAEEQRQRSEELQEAEIQEQENEKARKEQGRFQFLKKINFSKP